MLGAGGPTGTECIKRLAELGIVARAVVRTPDKYREKLKAIDPKAGFILADKAGPCASTHVLSAGFRLRLWQAMSLKQRVLQQRCKELVALFLPPVARLSSLQAPWTSRCLLEPAEVLWAPATHKGGLHVALPSCRALPMWRQLAKLQGLGAWFWSALHWSPPRTGTYTSLLCSLPDLTQAVAVCGSQISLRLTLPGTPCRLHPIRILLNNMRWSLMDNKFAGNALPSSRQD